MYVYTLRLEEYMDFTKWSRKSFSPTLVGRIIEFGSRAPPKNWVRLPRGASALGPAGTPAPRRTAAATSEGIGNARSMAALFGFERAEAVTGTGSV